MANSSGIWNLVRVGVTVVLLIVSGLVWYGRKTKIGTKLQITSKESVNYSGTVTEEEARALGRRLQDTGYFNGEGERDVLFHKGDDGASVSFVVQDGKWNDPEIVQGFESFGRQIAATVGKPPFALLLIDDHLNTKKSLTINNAESHFKHTAQETVKYFDDVTEDDARRLAEALQAIGYFDNTAPAEVLLKTANGLYEVSFLVQDGSWDDAQIVAQYEEFGRQLAPMMGDGPLGVNMVDLDLHTQWSTTVVDDAAKSQDTSSLP